MDPRTHPRGAPPDFTLPKPNPNPQRMTDALWWLVCMRLQLEPLSENGGTLAIKPGYHSYGSRLPGFKNGAGLATTDHSIRRPPDRAGPWWADYTSAHDWTFTNAHHGDYTEINKYTNRLRNAMRSLTDLRPDDVYAYTIGQIDNDKTVEGWNEYKDDDETGDDSHLWHRHDSFRRNIIGSFPHMWKALTIDMGWTYAEWQKSVAPKEDDMATAAEIADAVWAKQLTLPDGKKVAASTILAWRDRAELDTRNQVTAAIQAAVAADDNDLSLSDEQVGMLAGLVSAQLVKAVNDDAAARLAA